jgi:hypothetical protein
MHSAGSQGAMICIVGNYTPAMAISCVWCVPPGVSR